jgi:hypothetical protein
MTGLDALTNARLSRRTLLKGTGAAGLGLALASAFPYESLAAQATSAAQAESIQDILDATVTTEMFGVTFLGAALDSASKGNYNPAIPAPVIAILTAARAQEQFHLEFFQSLGGKPLTQTFTIPNPALLTDSRLFFDTLQAQETREIAAQLAAFTTFTALKRPDLVKVSFQYAAEEAEHRVLANYAAGTRPANNYGFAPALYGSVAEFVAALRQLGVIGGSGPAATYPGPGTINPADVIERTPSGPAVNCTPAATTPPAPAPMPGLPNTGAGHGATGGDAVQRMLGLLGVAGIGAAAAALSRRRATAEARANQE